MQRFKSDVILTLASPFCRSSGLIHTSSSVHDKDVDLESESEDEGVFGRRLKVPIMAGMIVGSVLRALISSVCLTTEYELLIHAEL